MSEEMTEKRGRTLAICVGIIAVTLAICVLILFYDRKFAASYDDEEDEYATEAYEGQADDVCGQRLTQYTSDGELDLEQFLYSYGYKPTESGWVGEEGVLSFDYSMNDARPIIRFNTGAKKYERQVSVTQDDTIDCVQAKIGVKHFTMSRADMTAIGRIIIGITDDFNETEE